MNKILTTLIGTSLLTGALYAGQHSSMNNAKGCKAHSKCQYSCNIDDKKSSKSDSQLRFEKLVHEDSQEES